MKKTNSGENIKFSKFTHATKHLKKSQHRLDPNIDLKHLVHHSVKQYVDRDADGDVDVFDNPKKKIPDENVQSGSTANSLSNKLIAKQKGELKHTRRGMAYEEIESELETMITEKKKGLWPNIHAKRKRGERAAKPGEKGYPETLDIEEGIEQARKNVGASKCWKSKKLGNPSTKMKDGKEVPNCVDEENNIDEIFLLTPRRRRRRNGDDRYRSPESSKKKARELIDAQIARQDAERAELRRKHAMKEENEKIRYCPRCGKNETRSECKYGKNYWDMFSLPSTLIPSNLKFSISSMHPTNEEKDHEHSMARVEISKIISAAKRLRGKVKGEGNLPAWVQSKITRAADYIDSVADYADSGEMHKEGYSFDINPEKHKSLNKGQKLYNKGIRTDNPNEKEQFLKRTGPQLPLASKNKKTDLAHYDLKTFGSFMQEAASKSSMKCNSPKSDPVGDSLTGKSHVVKACENGEEKIIRFGQRGVKGSPKKKGESKQYKNRRDRFKARHAKNIAKGKMSAAYWANKVKW